MPLGILTIKELLQHHEVGGQAPTPGPGEMLVTGVNVTHGPGGWSNITIDGTAHTNSLTSVADHIHHSVADPNETRMREFANLVSSSLGFVMSDLDGQVAQNLQMVVGKIKSIFPWIHPTHDLSLVISNACICFKTELSNSTCLRVKKRSGKPLINFHLLFQKPGLRTDKTYYEKYEYDVNPREGDVIACLSKIYSLFQSENAEPFKPCKINPPGRAMSDAVVIRNENGEVRLANLDFERMSKMDEVAFIGPRRVSFLLPRAGVWVYSPNLHYIDVLEAEGTFSPTTQAHEITAPPELL